MIWKCHMMSCLRGTLLIRSRKLEKIDKWSSIHRDSQHWCMSHLRWAACGWTSFEICGLGCTGLTESVNKPQQVKIQNEDFSLWHFEKSYLWSRGKGYIFSNQRWNNFMLSQSMVVFISSVYIGFLEQKQWWTALIQAKKICHHQKPLGIYTPIHSDEVVPI